MNPPPASAPIAASEYATDDVSAIVLDPGYASIRAGFAGDDVPKCVLPSYYGRYPTRDAPAGDADADADADADEDGEGKQRYKHVFGDEIYVRPRPRMSIHNPMGRDGVVEDWDMAEKLWEHAYTSRLTGTKAANPMGRLDDVTQQQQQQSMESLEEKDRPLAENPLLMTECGWSPVKTRERLVEMAMESWGTPAFYLARAGLLSAFAAAKETALVIDIGAANTSVTPVREGLAIKRGIQHAPYGGDFITSQVRALFKANKPHPITITPHYAISSRSAVEPGQPAQAVYKDIPPHLAPDASYRRLLEDRTIAEYKESIVQVWPGTGPLSASSVTAPNETVPNVEIARVKCPPRPFEFPDGYNQPFGVDALRPAEALFDAPAYIPQDAAGSSEPGAGAMPIPGPPTAAQTVTGLVRASLSQVDVDVRPLLLANVVVTGTTSLIQGLNDRLSTDLVGAFPGARVRVSAAGNVAERKYGAWIGGSIVASLETFNQMWISRKEYEEHGPGIVEMRCK